MIVASGAPLWKVATTHFAGFALLQFWFEMSWAASTGQKTEWWFFFFCPDKMAAGNRRGEFETGDEGALRSDGGETSEERTDGEGVEDSGTRVGCNKLMLS